MVGEQSMKIGEAARLIGVPAWRLRDWEARGLLMPERTASGYRLFTVEQIAVGRGLARVTDREELMANATALRAEADASMGESPAFLPRGGQDIAFPGASRQLRILRRIAHGVRHIEDLDRVLELALGGVLESTDSSVGAVSIADFTRQRYVLVASSGVSDRYVQGIGTWRLHEGLAGRSFGLREPLLIHDLQVERGVARDIVRTEGLRGYLCVPLLRGQRRLGIIEVFDREPRDFSIEEIAAVESIAAFVSSIVEARSVERELSYLRDERNRSFREWTTQLHAAVDAERQQRLAGIRELAARVASEPVMRPGDVATALTRLAEQADAGERTRIDIVPLVRDGVARAASDGRAVRVDVEPALGWPTALPTEFASRLYLVVRALVEACADLAISVVTVQLDQIDGDLVVVITDDRTDDDADRRSSLSDDVLTAVRGIGGSLDTTAHDLRLVIPRRATDSRVESLTTRERRVLELLPSGLPNRELAEHLGISQKTLQNHLGAIYRKLGVASRLQALRFVAE